VSDCLLKNRFWILPQTKFSGEKDNIYPKAIS
jgi:hypothetical protein